MPISSQQDVILHYKGQLQFDQIGELIHVLKEKMRVRKAGYSVFKKMLMIMIELLENIIRYRENFDGNSFIISNYPPEFQIFHIDGSYFIESANAILKQDIPKLESRLNEINSLNKESIRKLYKATITDGKFSEKGGAGLGIIEMAKMSDEKMTFSFFDIDEYFSYYIIKVVVKDHGIPKKPIED